MLPEDEDLRKIINSNKDLCRDIDSAIGKLLKSRKDKDIIQEQKAYFEMESLMVTVQQQLTAINDFFKI